MNYYELIFTLITPEDYQRDLLIDELAALEFDTFEETEFGFNAYIPADSFDRDEVEETLEPYHDQFTFNYEVNLIPQKNWNEVWESNFEPIDIEQKVWVRATFHEARPDYPYEIVVDPKMAFGTGHHQTTAMMLALMLENDLTGKQVLDMGCGTGILAIMAAKLNAESIVAIDYDPVCYESTLENAQLNQVDNIIALCGSKEVIPAAQYDVILANINRNILLDQMESYYLALKPGGEIYFSGFYESPDMEVITAAAEAYGISYIAHRKMNEWVAARFAKQP